MRRMHAMQRLHLLFTVVSLLVSLAFAGIWVRSCWWKDDVFVGREATTNHWSHTLLISSWSGSIHVQFTSRDSQPSASSQLWYNGARSVPVTGPLRGEPWHRFYYVFRIDDAEADLMIGGQHVPPETEVVRYASAPHAAFVLIFLVLPMVEAVRALRSRCVTPQERLTATA